MFFSLKLAVRGPMSAERWDTGDVLKSLAAERIHSMKKEELIEIGLTEEQAGQVLAMNGKDVEREKGRTATAKADLEEARGQLEQRTADLEALKKTTGDADAVKAQLEELSAKYKTETEALQKQLSDRDYADAMTAAIAQMGVKFSSKAAERAFREDLRASGLKLREGALDGFDAFLKAQREADPAAFAPEKPPAQIVSAVGVGSPPPSRPSRAAQIERDYHNRLYGTKGE